MEVSPYRSLMIFIDASAFNKDSPTPLYSNNSFMLHVKCYAKQAKSQK